MKHFLIFIIIILIIGFFSIAATWFFEYRLRWPVVSYFFSGFDSWEMVKYPKRVMLTLENWSDAEQAAALIKKNGGQIIKLVHWPEKNVVIALLPDKDAEQIIRRDAFWGGIVGFFGFTGAGNKIGGGIDSVITDGKVSADSAQVPNWGVLRIKANEAWAMSRGSGVRIALLDSGIQRDHPDLAANIKGGINFIAGLGADQWGDDGGHGTHVAGIIAALDNDFGVVGAAPEANLFGVKVLDGAGSGYWSDVISGIYWAVENNMKIANISLGGPQGFDELKNAVDYAYQHGVLLVASAGNNGASGGAVSYPGAYDSVIAVSATIPDDRLASFSSYGPQVELAAPGSEINSTSNNSLYSALSGTSLAAPFVSGAAALVWAKNPQFTAVQVREQLRATAIDLGMPGKDNQYGYGLVNGRESVIARLPASLILLSPRGGEQWQQGTLHNIFWSSQNLNQNENVDINLIRQYTVYDDLWDSAGVVSSGGASAGAQCDQFLSTYNRIYAPNERYSINTHRPHCTFNKFIRRQVVREAVEAISIAKGTINDGMEEWAVPADLPPEGRYFVEVKCGQDFVGVCQPGKSSEFSIAFTPPQSFSILFPNGGEQWPLGSSQSVIWSSSYYGLVGVDISLFQNKSTPQYSLEKEIGSPWVGIGSAANPDTCDGNRASRENGGVYACPATNSNGSFTCSDIAESRDTAGYYFQREVACSYLVSGTTDTLELVRLLESGINNDGSEIIVIPADLPLSDQYFIQVGCSRFSGSCVPGRSGQALSIVSDSPAGLSILSSGGNEQWQAGKMQTVSWQSVDYPSDGTVDIYLLKKTTGALRSFLNVITFDAIKDYEIFKPLMLEAPNTGRAMIIVPEDINAGDEYLIQIVCGKNTLRAPCHGDISDKPFRILAPNFDNSSEERNFSVPYVASTTIINNQTRFPYRRAVQPSKLKPGFYEIRP
ncbi:MAG: S8 family serine peptidase [Candidatus Harrisonbacteria bacterium]|nr:S8 family serine peptidase [Candidatus Harrisonbacteria bacterium]